MHSLEIYSIRVYDSLLPGDAEERYTDLSKVRGYSLGDVLKESLDHSTDDYVDIVELIKKHNPERDIKKIVPRIFKCTDINKNGTIITGYLNVGEYGTKNDIINRKSGAKVGQVKVDDSVMRDHFFYIEVRPGEKQAMLLLQSIRGRGVKSVFEDVIRPKMKEITGGLVCQIRPLSNKALVKEWQENGLVCNIILSRFHENSPLQDIADRLEDAYTQIIIKPNKKTGRLGKLVDLDSGLIEMLQEKSSMVKAQIELNGRKRIFQLGSDEDDVVSSIELDEDDSDIKFINGNPTKSSIKDFASKLAEDMWKTIV